MTPHKPRQHTHTHPHINIYTAQPPPPPHQQNARRRNARTDAHGGEEDGPEDDQDVPAVDLAGAVVHAPGVPLVVVGDFLSSGWVVVVLEVLVVVDEEEEEEEVRFVSGSCHVIVAMCWLHATQRWSDPHTTTHTTTHTTLPP
jgi:hypothetical protein